MTHPRTGFWSGYLRLFLANEYNGQCPERAFAPYIEYLQQIFDFAGQVSIYYDKNEYNEATKNRALPRLA